MEMITANSQEFTFAGFWEKVTSCFKKAGREVIEKALILIYALDDENVPAWAKTLIIGALAYFISPVDAIPDFLPGVGYVDDLGMMGSALGTVYLYVSDETIEKARRKTEKIFS